MCAGGIGGNDIRDCETKKMAKLCQRESRESFIHIVEINRAGWKTKLVRKEICA